MKIIARILLLITVFASLTACNDYETYADKKEKERDAIRDFIRDNQIVRIEESVFKNNGFVTDTAKNEYVYMNNTGVYMQIVRKGNGRPLENGENASLNVRFLEVNIMDTTYVVTNYDAPYNPDIMNINRTGTTYTASFISGEMYNNYSASVPSGWLVPFNYINLDGPTADEDIAKVRLIVPHTQGHSIASGNVYPYFYEITFQR